MTRPRLRRDRRCWAGCGRFAAVIDLSIFAPAEIVGLKAQPRACKAHHDYVLAEAIVQACRWHEKRLRHVGLLEPPGGDDRTAA